MHVGTALAANKQVDSEHFAAKAAPTKKSGMRHCGHEAPMVLRSRFAG
jgi:hypothetical protein